MKEKDTNNFVILNCQGKKLGNFIDQDCFKFLFASSTVNVNNSNEFVSGILNSLTKKVYSPSVASLLHLGATGIQLWKENKEDFLNK